MRACVRVGVFGIVSSSSAALAIRPCSLGRGNVFSREGLRVLLVGITETIVQLSFAQEAKSIFDGSGDMLLPGRTLSGTNNTPTPAAPLGSWFALPLVQTPEGSRLPAGFSSSPPPCLRLWCLKATMSGGENPEFVPSPKQHLLMHLPRWFSLSVSHASGEFPFFLVN